MIDFMQKKFKSKSLAVLIVDDVQVNVMGLSVLLEQIPVIKKIDVAYNGEQAIKKVLDNSNSKSEL